MAPADHPECHFAASALAAMLGFPLWKASAIGQSGFDKGRHKGLISGFLEALKPPYRGVTATILGMTWARGAIFYGSDWGKSALERYGINNRAVTTTVPPLFISSFVQVVNMPIIRATISIQNPTSEWNSVMQAMRELYRTRGVGGLWHGTSAGLLKTCPKYMTAVAVKDFMDEALAKVDPHDRLANLIRSAKKSVAAGVLSAGLTNPMDVLRNEMFKTDKGVRDTLIILDKEYGWGWMMRGMQKNLIAVAFPIAVTIFATDVLVRLKIG